MGCFLSHFFKKLQVFGCSIPRPFLCFLSPFLLLAFMATPVPGVDWAWANEGQGDEVYDPFADYSEFEEDSQQEMDIHFFKNGRFFNVALLFGGRMFTSNMSEYLGSNFGSGLYIAFFFNLRMALQFSYTFSEHALTIPGTDSSNSISGNLSYSDLAFDFKYYINTQNVTRGLADINPYFLVGFSQNYRIWSVEFAPVVSKDNSSGLDLGLGIEVPMARNQMYVGLEAVYTFVNFPTENKEFQDDNKEGTGAFLRGDPIRTHLVLGVNF